MLDHLYLLLFITGFFAGSIDAIAGGGGLISLPVLLSVGIPPHVALGTNKLQSSIGTLVATHSYYRARLFSFKTALPGLISGLIGTVLGAVLSQLLDSSILKKIIPILLLMIFFYTLLSPKLGSGDRKPRASEFIFFMLVGFMLGFYDGFLGPGTGSFWVFLIIFFLGYSFTKATAYTKIFNLNSNLVALICFALGSNIDYKIGLTMAAGQLLGSKMGAHLAIKNGAKLIRPIFITIVSITIFSLFYQNYNHLFVMNLFLDNQLLMLLPALIVILVPLFYLFLKKKSGKTI